MKNTIKMKYLLLVLILIGKVSSAQTISLTTNASDPCVLDVDGDVKKFTGKEDIVFKIIPHEGTAVDLAILTFGGENILESVEVTEGSFDRLFTIKKEDLPEESEASLTIGYKISNEACAEEEQLLISREKDDNNNNTDDPEADAKEYSHKLYEALKNTNFSNLNYYTKPDSNAVDLYFDRYGNMLNNVPANANHETKFRLHIYDKVEELYKYTIEVTQGDYSPSDLSLRPFEKISAKSVDEANVTSTGEGDVVEYGWKDFEKGPFTTEFFKFKVIYYKVLNRNAKEVTQKKYESVVHSIRLNKLYHLGVGVSLVKTNLSTPDFHVAALNSGGNTIVATNTNARTLFTFNVIWYWTVLQNPKYSVITRGRDVLRDDQLFSVRRIFPTVGVTIDNEFKNNFFGGIVYEFARGGSLIAGVHYGKVQELADRDFKLGETSFSGSEDDILKNDKWKTAFFFGINVDTRILNLLFTRGQ